MTPWLRYVQVARYQAQELHLRANVLRLEQERPIIRSELRLSLSLRPARHPDPFRSQQQTCKKSRRESNPKPSVPSGVPTFLLEPLLIMQTVN